MPFTPRSVQISARILVKRYGVGALRRAETQVLRMERARAYAAANTWRQLVQAVRETLKEHPISPTASRSTAPPVEANGAAENKWYLS
jgi:hypothetical protein